MNIDWNSTETHIFFNNRIQDQLFVDPLYSYEGHIWLYTSGSSGFPKWVGLSKAAFLSSAAAVNRHIESDSSDVWVNTLPHFHVGGLAIFARAHLSGATLIDLWGESHKWNTERFIEQLELAQGTFTSLVPTQLHDIVKHELSAPASLRGVFVGGAFLSDHLYHFAKKLGWPLLPTYGLTECASQVATSLPSTEDLFVLDHVEVRLNPDLRLCLRSEALLTTYAIPDGPETITFQDPKIDGWFITEDRADLKGRWLRFLGRADDLVKIGGELVDVARLQRLLDEICLSKKIEADCVLVAIPEERLGHSIHLATNTTVEKLQEPLEHYHKSVLPFERIRQIHELPVIPRSSLNKPLKAELLKLLQNKSLLN